MSKLAWERAAGSAAKLATVSVIAAMAATTGVAATDTGYGPVVSAPYGPAYAQPTFGQPVYGQPVYGQPFYGHQGVVEGAQIAPATTATYGSPVAVESAPALANPAILGQPPHAVAGPHHGNLRHVSPHFGKRVPIFANTHANGVTYGPPSYTPPEGFDPKMASSSPFPSNWGNPAWGQQPQYRGQMPNLAGAPVYGGYGQAGRFAPAEPTYAPAEPLRPSYTAAPAAPVAAYEPAAEPMKEATIESASSYSYDVPATTAAPAYVGASEDISNTYTQSATNPYEVVLGQQPAAPVETGPVYEAMAQYQDAPAYEAAQTQTVPAYEMPAPTAPAVYQQATTYSAAVEAPAYETTIVAPAYEAASAYQTAPAYEAAVPQYQAVVPAQNFGSSAFSSGSNHFVQVGAFRNPNRAERLVRKLQDAGENAVIREAIVRGKKFYRVRVPALDKRDAKAVQSRMVGHGFYDTRVVRG